MQLHIRIAMLLAAACAAWQPSKAQANPEDTQFWQFAYVTGDLDANTQLTLDVTQRWRANASGADQQTVRLTLERTLAPGLRIGGGAMVLAARGNTELRPHQQISFAAGRFDFRTRLEERFFDNADRIELRLRQRIIYNQPLGNHWRASVGGEWLGLLQSRNRTEGASTEQWRAQVGIAHRLNQRLEIGANYWLLIFPAGAAPGRTSHVPQTVISYRF